MKKIILFAAKCFIVCFGTLFFLFILNQRYEQVRDNPYSDADKFFHMKEYPDIQICNLGSSHGENAFKYDQLAYARGYQCFNFAMSSQTYNYDYALLSMYKKQFADNCLMFIPVSYFSFNNEVTNEQEEQFLTAKYYTFLSPRYIPNYDPYIDIVTHYLPILSAGEDITKILPFPSPALKVFAAEAPAALSPEELAAKEVEFKEKAQNRYHRHMDDKEEYFLQERIDNLYDILAFCKENGITAVLITTPYTSLYSELFSPEFKEEFYAEVNAVASKADVPYYDFSNDERFSNRLELFAAADHHAVFSRQRVDVFQEGGVSSTQSARQYKDAADLIYQETTGPLTASDSKGPNAQYVSSDKLVVESPLLIRRLTTRECERLQGFPDDWTALPGAADSPRYRALGNSVAIPCVEYLMRGMALALLAG